MSRESRPLSSAETYADAAVATHAASGPSAHDATNIGFIPGLGSGLSSSTVWDALEELDDEKQPIDADLTAIAGLSPSNDDVLQRKSGAWANRTIAQLLADIVAAEGWTTVTKASDESVTNNTTLQNDDELFFAAASGSAYEVELYLRYTGDAAADLKCAFGEDGTVRGGMLTNSLGTTDGAQAAARNADQTATIGIGTSSTLRLAIIKGYYTGGGGTWRLLWANNSASGTTTIKAGSYLRYRVVA